MPDYHLDDGIRRTEPRLPDVIVDLGNLAGPEGNAYAILGNVRRAIRRAGHADRWDEFWTQATAVDYQHLLATVREWVEVVE